MKQSQWNEAMNLLDADLVESFVKKQENMAERKKNKVLWLRRGAVAACFMLVFAAFAGYFAFHGGKANSEVAAIITLDINPSFEIKIDKNEKKRPNSEFRTWLHDKLKDEIKEMIPSIIKRIEYRELVGHVFYFYIVPFENMENAQKEVLIQVLD